MSLHTKAAVGLLVMGLATTGCPGSADFLDLDRGGEFGYRVETVYAATFGVAGYGAAWSPLSTFFKSFGRVAATEFSSDGATTRSVAGYNEAMDTLIIFVDSILGADAAVIFPGNDEGVFVADGSDTSPQVRLAVDGSVFSTEHESGALQVVVESYPDVEGAYSVRATGSVVDADGSVVEFDVSFEATRQL